MRNFYTYSPYYDIQTNVERKWNVFLSKSKFGSWEPETNQILKIEDIAII